MVQGDIVFGQPEKERPPPPPAPQILQDLEEKCEGEEGLFGADCTDLLLSMTCKDAQEIVDYLEEIHGPTDDVAIQCDTMDSLIKSPSTTYSLMAYIAMVMKGVDLIGCPALVQLCKAGDGEVSRSIAQELHERLLVLRDIIVEELEIDTSCPTCQKCSLSGSGSGEAQVAQTKFDMAMNLCAESIHGGIDGNLIERGKFAKCVGAFEALTCDDVAASVEGKSEAEVCFGLSMLHAIVHDEDVEQKIRVLCRLGIKSLSIVQCEAITCAHKPRSGWITGSRCTRCCPKN